MAEVPGAKPSVKEALFTGQTQGAVSGRGARARQDISSVWWTQAFQEMQVCIPLKAVFVRTCFPKED
jgi:hypothetical protein